jgi:hypothetical protein
VQIKEKIKEIFSSKLIGITVGIIGILGSLTTMYAFFFNESRSALQYEIVADTSVLDIRADLSKLEILYDKSNLKERKENLRIITVRIVNTGNVNILKDSYDDEEPLGLKTEGGNIIETPDVLEGSTQYLKNNVKMYLVSPEMVKFSKVIIEPREYFTIKLLILHKEEILPKFIPVGKIAGIKSIKVVNIVESKKNQSFFAEVFSGAILIQFVRLFLYGLIAIVTTIGIILLIVQISDFFNQRKRKTIVGKFKKSKGYSYEETEDIIFRLFIEKDGYDFRNLLRLFRDYTNNDKLNEDYTSYLELEKKRSNSKTAMNKFKRCQYELYWIRKLIKDGIILKQDDKLTIDRSLKGLLERFINFLVENKYDDGRYNEYV